MVFDDFLRRPLTIDAYTNPERCGWNEAPLRRIQFTNVCMMYVIRICWCAYRHNCWLSADKHFNSFVYGCAWGRRISFVLIEKKSFIVNGSQKIHARLKPLLKNFQLYKYTWQMEDMSRDNFVSGDAHDIWNWIA